jgi:hypothetical protein
MGMVLGRALRSDTLLRIEGGILLLASVLFYRHLGGSWLLFAVTLLFPDLGAVGYLLSPRAGAIGYNAVHTYTLPAALLGAGLLSGHPLALAVATIWFAHIGMDRLVGYRLKVIGPIQALPHKPA